MIRFDGKTVIVTGAARGIGAGIAKTFATIGARVALVDLDDALLRERKDNEPAFNEGTVATYAGDVRDAAFLTETVARVVDDLGAVDVLINNAGIIRDNFLENVTEADWDEVLDVNLKGAFLACRTVVPFMKERGEGSIVNIISRSWLGNIGQVNYSASKGGLVSLTRTLALELARDNINVNGVSTGLIDTPMTRGLSEKVRERLLRSQPGRRMGTVEDIASAVCFLSSDRARFITGQILHVDGGKSCGALSV